MKQLTTKELFNLFVKKTIEKRPQHYMSTLDEKGEKRALQDFNFTLLKHLEISPQHNINVEILKGYQTPTTIKKYKNDENVMYYYLVDAEGIYGPFNHDLKFLKYTGFQMVYWPHLTESQTRKQAAEIIVISQDQKYYNAIKLKREKRRSLKNKAKESERLIIQKDFFNEYSEPKYQQRYKLINSYTQKTEQFNLTLDRLYYIVDKSGYYKFYFEDTLKVRLKKYKYENALKRIEPKKDQLNNIIDEKMKEIENAFLQDIKTCVNMSEFILLKNMYTENYIFKGLADYLDTLKILKRKLTENRTPETIENDIKKVLAFNYCEFKKENILKLKVEKKLDDYIKKIDYLERYNFADNYTNSETIASFILKKNLISYDHKKIYFSHKYDITKNFEIEL